MTEDATAVLARTVPGYSESSQAMSNTGETLRGRIPLRLFDGREPVPFLRGFDRPNLRLAFQPKDSPRKQVMSFVAARRGQSGIVYCASRARTESPRSSRSAPEACA